MKLAIAISVFAVTAFSSCADNAPMVKEEATTGTSRLEGEALIKRGEYLVATSGCHDCHSPKNLTPQGPKVDSAKLLSGHPAQSQLPPISPDNIKPGGWVYMSPDVTAFAGPWGISYAANLTPDSATGIGAWTEDIFIKTLRTGKHLGMENGRPILPPMPWEGVAQMTDEDLSALYNYLRSLPAIPNRVPGPTPPNEVGAKK